MLKPLIPIAILTLFTGAAYAQTDDNKESLKPSLNYIQIGKTDDRSFGGAGFFADSANGLSVKGSFEIGDNWYIPYWYEKLDESSVIEQRFSDFDGDSVNFTDVNLGVEQERTSYAIGVGYRWELSANAILAADISYINRDYKFGASIIDQNSIDIDDQNLAGYVNGNRRVDSSGDDLKVSVQYLHKLNKQWQLGIGVVASTPEFQNDDNVESSISAEAMYFINDSWSVVAQAEIGNIKTSTLGVRYSF